jgi:CRISPR-associated protein Csd1
MAIQRILPCILDTSPIPRDIEQLCFLAASNLFTLDEGLRGKTLETACAVIRYNYFVRQKKEYNVGLEEERTTRSYLFGRLLAVADKIESQVLHAREETRETNAVRYMQRFSRHPASTWKLLYVEKLRPYFAHLPENGRSANEKIIQEIMDKFVHGDFESDDALSEEFLLGYHCQQKKFWDDYAARKSQKDGSVNTTQGEE